MDSFSTEALAEAAGQTVEEYREWLRARRAASKGGFGEARSFDDHDATPATQERLNSEPARPEGQGGGDGATTEQRIARVRQFAKDLGRKAEINDITTQVTKDAETWLRQYAGDFEFLLDLRKRGGHLSAAQAKGVVNCIRNERPKADTPFERPSIADVERATSTADAPKTAGDVPEGLHVYNDAVYQVRRSATGNLWAKVLELPEPGEERGRWEYVGRKPLANLSIDTVATLESLARFGKLFGTCGCCGALLTNQDSIDRGIGPICAAKYA